MLTLKFHDKSTDEWEVVSAERYYVKPVDSVKQVTTYGTDDITFTVGVGGYDVCYVVNIEGNTVDRIHP